jgi:hypothetical protein
MTDAPGIQSMDCVQTDDWLVVTRGPAQHKKDGKTFYPQEWEGVLLNVLAVSPPMLLVRLFPFPGQGLAPRAVELALHWDRQRFSRATPKYVEQYLQLAGFNRAGKKVRAVETVIPPLPADKPKRRRKTGLVDGKIQELPEANDE